VKGAPVPRLSSPSRVWNVAVSSTLSAPPCEAPPRRNAGRVTQGVRPNLQHSRRIHPEGSVTTPGGATHSRNARERTIGKGHKPEPPSKSKGYLPASHAGKWRADLPRLSKGRRVFRSPHDETFAGRLRSFRERVRREVEGDVRSSGVPMDVVECKKHRESSLKKAWQQAPDQRVQAVPLKRQWFFNSPARPLAATFGSAAWRVRDLDGGRREGEVIFAWKRGSSSFSRA